MNFNRVKDVLDIIERDHSRMADERRFSKSEIDPDYVMVQYVDLYIDTRDMEVFTINFRGIHNAKNQNIHKKKAFRIETEDELNKMWRFLRNE